MLTPTLVFVVLAYLPVVLLTTFIPTLTLSTLAERGSEAHQAAVRFAERVAEDTDRRIQIQVRPASELGDWPEVHEGIVYGAVDLADRFSHHAPGTGPLHLVDRFFRACAQLPPDSE